MSERYPIHIVKNKHQLQTALQIREIVFAKEQGISKNMDVDGKDQQAIHVLVFDRGVGIATGRLLCEKDLKGYISRIAVLNNYRSRKLGSRIIEFLESEAKKLGALEVYLHPHDYLEAFYHNLGYQTIPNSGFFVGRYRLIKMTKNISLKTTET